MGKVLDFLIMRIKGDDACKVVRKLCGSSKDSIDDVYYHYYHLLL